MKIVLTVPLEEPVPPIKYGGTELVVSLLAEEYTRAGHEVYLLGTGDSTTSAHLAPVLPQAIRRMPSSLQSGPMRDYWKYYSAAKIIETINSLKPDLVHNHFAWRLIAFENLITVPMMSTMHGPISDPKEVTTYHNHASHPYISISDNQQKALQDINWIGTVHNGIDINKYSVNLKKEDRNYFLFLGRTSPEKGLAEIVELVKGTKYKLKIAAKLDTVDQEYFDTRVKPFVDEEQIEYVGEVGLEQKVELLQHAKALLLWLNWEEPFGLVIPEAGACGTPVIVNRRGSMPELVRDGETGYLVNTLDEMKERMTHVTEINPAKARTHVESHFTSTIMAQKYLKLARKIITSS
jgi:glycosyltransferase involved in cell wall biosynthesis